MTTPPVTIDDLVTEHSASMYRVALSLMRDHSLAEDIVQESIMKAWQALDGFRGESSVKTWLLQITHNTAISSLRKRRDDLMSPYELPDRPATGSVEEDAVIQADAHEIWAALRTLDELSRTIVVLREVDQMSYEEIADVLDLPVGTVRTRLFRARQQLTKAAAPSVRERSNGGGA